MLSYHKLREWLSEQEHIQWEYWSKTLGEELESFYCILKTANIEDIPLDRERELVKEVIDKIDSRLRRWKKNWKPYKKLREDIKDYDREWADKILDNLPFKCPMYQCGGLMVAKERPYPKGMNEDDFPDGMAGDSQTPDLICTNCKAVYHFDGFKNRHKSHKPEVNQSHNNQQNKPCEVSGNSSQP